MTETRLFRDEQGPARPAPERKPVAAATEPQPDLPSHLPAVAVLLCTYNGQRFIAEQLDSIARQSVGTWRVWASDDGSRDDTVRILEAYRSGWGEERLSVLAGPASGFAANFLSLACNPAVKADYYAFADQDDIWEHDKLARAVEWLNTIPNDVPALYCARTRLVDAGGRPVGFSEHYRRPPSFANALVQNIGSGNTMVFNEAARNLLREAGADVGVVLHDWWLYMIVSGCGGEVFYDPAPSLRYRQHEGNLVGGTVNWRARLGRIRLLLKGRFRHWNDRNVAALQKLRHRLTPENRSIFDSYVASRDRGLLPRLRGLYRSGVYRQTTLGNLGLLAAAILKKM